MIPDMTKSLEREVGEVTERVAALAQYARELGEDVKNLERKLDTLISLTNSRASTAALVVSVVSGVSAGIGAGIYKMLQALKVIS